MNWGMRKLLDEVDLAETGEKLFSPELQRITGWTIDQFLREPDRKESDSDVMNYWKGVYLLVFDLHWSLYTTEIPNEQVTLGSYCWALRSNQLVVVCKTTPHFYEMGGIGWGGGISAELLKIVSIIPKPAAHEKRELYYKNFIDQMETKVCY